MPLKIYFLVRFKALGGYALNIKSVKLSMELIKELNEKYFPDVRGDIYIPDVIDGLVIPETEIKVEQSVVEGMSDLPKNTNEINVEVPKDYLNRFYKYELQGSGDHQKVIVKLDKEKTIKKWVEEGCPLQWGGSADQLRVVDVNAAG